MIACPLELIYDCIEGSIGPCRPLQALRNSELLAVNLLCHTTNLGSQLLRENLVQVKPTRQWQTCSKCWLPTPFKLHAYKIYMHTWPMDVSYLLDSCEQSWTLLPNPRVRWRVWYYQRLLMEPLADKHNIRTCVYKCPQWISQFILVYSMVCTIPSAPCTKNAYVHTFKYAQYVHTPGISLPCSLLAAGIAYSFPGWCSGVFRGHSMGQNDNEQSCPVSYMHHSLCFPL